MGKNSLFYSRVEPRFKIFYSYVYKKQSYIELIEMAHLPKKTVENDFFQKMEKNSLFYCILEWSLDLKYYIHKCTRNKVMLK